MVVSLEGHPTTIDIARGIWCNYQHRSRDLLNLSTSLEGLDTTNRHRSRYEYLLHHITSLEEIGTAVIIVRCTCYTTSHRSRKKQEYRDCLEAPCKCRSGHIPIWCRRNFSILTCGVHVIRCKIHKSRELAASLTILTGGIDVIRCEMHEYGVLLCIMALTPWREQNIGKCRNMPKSPLPGLYDTSL